MNRLILAGVLVALALPAAAHASGTDRTNAAQECRYERGATAATHEAFAAKYRTFGKCVSAKARDEAAERKSAKTNAARACKAERGTTPETRKAFKAKYGNKANAMGKCVSAAAKAQEDKADAADRAAAGKRKQAAKRCARERTTSRSAFVAKYRTFGKCVAT